MDDMNPLLAQNYLALKIKTSHYGVADSKDYNRALQQNPNIKNQLNMFGKPCLSPKHMSPAEKTDNTFAVTDEKQLDEWNLNYSLDGNVNFISQALSGSIVKTAAT
jgi:hypothetical protein